ncbi:MAG TPA: hypothetical protein VD865_14715 [Stenotrophomonas sp.]|nr:hypothetical protein [Stenotrophomonas sp.]
MRIIVAIALTASLTACVTTRSPSQAIHSYQSARPAAEVSACVAEVFTPRYYGGVGVQGGWPEKPVGMAIRPSGTGSVVTTRGPLDHELATCLDQ